MSDSLDTIKKLLREHEQALYGVRKLDIALNDLTSLRQQWIPGSSFSYEQRLAQLEQSLDSMHKDLSEHMRFEEETFLPILIKIAPEIIRRGLLSEHIEILDSIINMKRKVQALVRKPTDREEIIGVELHVRESLSIVLEYVEEHTHTQDIIFNLAREALTTE